MLICLLPAASAAAVSKTALDMIAGQYVKNGGFAVEKKGNTAWACNSDQLLIPASILKIATITAALDILGPDYRFTTEFYQSRDGDLYVHGTGDPFLISEEIALIMDRLKKTGVREIRNILLDDTAYDLSLPADGTGQSSNPFDAVNAALAVNFNTVHISVSTEGVVSSAEPQTPFLSLMAEAGKNLAAGTYRLNISRSQKKYGKNGVVRYVGELFRAIQKEKKIAGCGVISRGRVPDGLPLLYVHSSSRNLSAMIQPLMRYSNNFIANQLFLACGARLYGYPATWAKGRAAVNKILAGKLGFSVDDLRMVEGSGLSRRNRITPAAMLKILAAFKPYARYLSPDKQGRLIKSGTLTGVYSYAGYMPGRNHELDGFVIILNQKENRRGRLLGLLGRFHQEAGISP